MYKFVKNKENYRILLYNNYGGNDMTPHISAKENEIAKTVIMPGDPLRAKMIAEKYLENYKLVSDVRNIYAYTGKYKGKEVTVMASGMGMPSIGIYSYELFKFYNVENIIRVGSCGSYTKDLNLYDIVLVNDCYSETSYAKTQNGCEDNVMHSSNILNAYIRNSAMELDIPITIANVHSSDVFYKENDNFKEIAKNGYLAVEMESFALFHNANVLNKQASCLLTVSDNFITKESISIEERMNSFLKMIEIALNSI